VLLYASISILPASAAPLILSNESTGSCGTVLETKKASRLMSSRVGKISNRRLIKYLLICYSILLSLSGENKRNLVELSFVLASYGIGDAALKVLAM